MTDSATTMVTGTVTSASQNGVKLDHSEEWINLPWRQPGVPPPISMPAKGHRVTLTLDSKGKIIGVTPAEPAQPAAATPSASALQAPAAANSYAAHDRTVCREWAVNAAANLCGFGPGGSSLTDERSESDLHASLNSVMHLADSLAAWAQSGEPWAPMPTEPPTKPAAPQDDARAVPQPQHTPAPARAASAPIVGGKGGGPHVYDPGPRDPVMPPVEVAAGRDVPDWASEPSDAAAVPSKVATFATAEQVAIIRDDVKRLGWSSEAAQRWLARQYGALHPDNLTVAQANAVIEALSNEQAKAAAR